MRLIFGATPRVSRHLQPLPKVLVAAKLIELKLFVVREDFCSEAIDWDTSKVFGEASGPVNRSIGIFGP